MENEFENKASRFAAEHKNLIKSIQKLGSRQTDIKISFQKCDESSFNLHLIFNLNSFWTSLKSRTVEVHVFKCQKRQNFSLEMFDKKISIVELFLKFLRSIFFCLKCVTERPLTMAVRAST